MTLGERIKSLRLYLKISQEEFGNVLGISKSAISLVERNERSLSYSQLLSLINEFHIDPRYFFGIIDEPSDANMDKKEQNDMTLLFHEIREIKKTVKPASEIDPIAHRVSIIHELREIVDPIKFLDSQVLREIKAMVLGYVTCLDNSKKAIPGDDPKGESGQSIA